MAKYETRVLSVSSPLSYTDTHQRNVVEVLQRINDEGGRLVSTGLITTSEKRVESFYYEVPVPETIHPATGVESLEDTLLGRR